MLTSNLGQHAEDADRSLTFPTRVTREVVDPSACCAWQGCSCLTPQPFREGVVA